MNFRRIVNIDFRRCAIGLWKSRFFILLLMAVGMAAGILAAVFVVPKDNEYTATASIYCVAYGSYADSANGMEAMRTYSEIIKSRRVAEHAAMLIADPDITDVDVFNQIEVDPLVVQGATYVYNTNSSILTMHATCEKEHYAVSIVNAVADAFVQEVNTISDTEAIQVLDYAYDGELTYNAMLSCFLAVLAGTVAGMILGCLIILALVIFTDRVISVDDAGLYGKLKVIGIIPEFEPSRRA